MSESIISPPKRIFVIGPMTRGAKDRKGRRVREHIPNIAKATNQILERLQAKYEDRWQPWEVITPPDQTGSDIPQAVFSHIMHCDLAIADISGQSPNVIYEIAMLHALGTPVILLKFEDEPIFYFNHQNSIDLDDYKMTSIRKALEEVSPSDNLGRLERTLLTPPSAKYYNPITKYFDGVHLVNVAAAAGVATGQYFNFLRWILADGGIWKKHPELEAIILLKPRTLADVDTWTGRLEKQFGTEVIGRDGTVVTDADGNPKIELAKANIDDDKHPRGFYFAYRVGNMLVDYPTPISSLQISRQVVAFGNYLEEYSEGFTAEYAAPFEARLIDIYFDTLKELATKPPFGSNWRKVKIMDIDEAEEFLRNHLADIA